VRRKEEIALLVYYYFCFSNAQPKERGVPEVSSCPALAPSKQKNKIRRKGKKEIMGKVRQFFFPRISQLQERVL
jgi:hypothetical protein